MQLLISATAVMAFSRILVLLRSDNLRFVFNVPGER